VWCADRAALLLMIRIDKLKTREKYERHFLLLSLVFTLMVRVRKWCDDTFGSLTEPTKLSTFARPKAGSTCSTFFCQCRGSVTLETCKKVAKILKISGTHKKRLEEGQV
jgi:hypothetical protein